MGTFELYIKLGWEHLTDFNGYDHMLFLTAMILGYALKDWKQVLTLVTAFTIGHSLALALAVFKIVSFNSDFIEYGILISIALLALKRYLTTIGNFFKTKNIKAEYILVLFFGVIHGLGFSNYLSAILNQEIWKALLGFNLGLEIAQIVFVAIALGFLTLLHYLFKHKIAIINKAIALIIVLWSLVLIIIK